MAQIELSAKFQRSLKDFKLYPCNSSHTSVWTAQSTLGSLSARLDELEDTSFVSPDKVEMSYRDFDNWQGKALDKRNIHDLPKLADWLGMSERVGNGQTRTSEILARGRDPVCRAIFMYCHGGSSRSPLKITREMLTTVFTYHQVMPEFLDYLFVFGLHSGPRDLRFSGFREQVNLRAPRTIDASSDLRRSGRNFQICYNLKNVERKRQDDHDFCNDEWSIRQVCVNHHFDVETRHALWVAVKGANDLQQRFRDLTGTESSDDLNNFSTSQSRFRSSLATHLMYAYWCTEGWRWYIDWLEEVVDQKSEIAVYGPLEPGRAHNIYKPSHIQTMQGWHDKACQAIMVLESNLDILSCLKRFYEKISKHPDAPQPFRTDCHPCMADFRAHVSNVMDDLRMQVARIKLLARTINDRKSLITLHLQGQVAERTESLTKRMEKEAIVMRIVTLVTLIYLPATFVSTFFSTDVVKYQNQGEDPPGSGTFSGVALERWLQVTVPLTLLTLFVAWTAYESAKQSEGPTRFSYLTARVLSRLRRKAQKPVLPVHEKDGLTKNDRPA